MDQAKSGGLIRTLRTEKQLTQKQLADLMGISDKTVSKWERGLGFPDVALLPALAGILGIDLDYLISGENPSHETNGGNMNKLKFHICPVCHNIITTTSANSTISCCGKSLKSLTPLKPDPEHMLSTEKIETDLFIHSDHEMSKQHYISFVALLTGDTLTIRKLYPEWCLQTRIPLRSHGTLLWYCTGHGLFYKYV